MACVGWSTHKILSFQLLSWWRHACCVFRLCVFFLHSSFAAITAVTAVSIWVCVNMDCFAESFKVKFKLCDDSFLWPHTNWQISCVTVSHIYWICTDRFYRWIPTLLSYLFFTKLIKEWCLWNLIILSLNCSIWIMERREEQKLKLFLARREEWGEK